METETACPTSTATILACQKITKSFTENIYELSTIRREWDPEYANSLLEWVSNTTQKFYSDNLDSIKDKAYIDWHEVMVKGLQSLSILRASIKVDFKTNTHFIKNSLNKLGYNDFYSDAKNGDHNSLYNLLKTFAENLDENTYNLIIQKGVPESVFSKILEAATQIKAFKGCIDNLENENSLSSSEMNEVANIYEIIQDICRIASAYFQFDPLKRAEFNFYKVMVSL